LALEGHTDHHRKQALHLKALKEANLFLADSLHTVAAMVAVPILLEVRVGLVVAQVETQLKPQQQQYLVKEILVVYLISVVDLAAAVLVAQENLDQSLVTHMAEAEWLLL